MITLPDNGCKDPITAARTTQQLHRPGNTQANEVHKDMLPGDSHVTAMESIKDEFGLKASATTTPGLLKV